MKEAASDEVVFPGAIYDKPVVQALRYHAQCYVHGHQVGGTNPSLVEALGAGNAVLAHDNPYNRWVSGDAGAYFRDEADCEVLINKLLSDESELARMREASRSRHEAEFTWDKVLGRYELLLSGWSG